MAHAPLRHRARFPELPAVCAVQRDRVDAGGVVMDYYASYIAADAYVKKVTAERDALRAKFRVYVRGHHNDYNDGYSAACSEILPACPKCGAREEYQYYDRVYFEGEGSSQCTPAEGNCKKCGYEWQEHAGDYDDAYSWEEIKALKRKAADLASYRDMCVELVAALEAKIEQLKSLNCYCDNKTDATLTRARLRLKGQGEEVGK